MRYFKLILLFLFILCGTSWATPPTRAYNYVPNATIDSNQNNTNENSLYAYLQTGVDTYAPGSISSSDINANAAISYSQLSLSNSIVNADINSSAAIATSKIAFSSGQLVPSGVIMMWSGTIATIPSGYYLCDGTNGTPDLRDKFIVGAKQDSGGVAKTNITGSLTQSGGSTTIATGNLPASGLTLTIPLYSPNAGGTSGVPQNTPGPSDTTSNTYTTSNMGSGNPYTQPYFALAYIMKS